ncbi:MAG: alkaline phosphatase D family protein [Acidimicrobiia bacterium]|nr:alkaline phosphatase D family protein [Acidimicrobiia bacterium]
MTRRRPRCASASRPARPGRAGTTPRTSTWPPRISTSSSSSATTSTRAAARTSAPTTAVRSSPSTRTGTATASTRATRTSRRPTPAFPWMVTWDDHEVDNNYADDHQENGDPPDQFLQRRAAAYQAWYEHQPVRLTPPTGPDLEIHRRRPASGDLAGHPPPRHRASTGDRQVREVDHGRLLAEPRVRDEIEAAGPRDARIRGSSSSGWPTGWPRPAAAGRCSAPAR